MSARQKDWAKRTRERLLRILGGKCRHCGTTECLTFDCIIAQGHWHHALDTSSRMSFYRAQMRAGNLQVLCSRCNSIKGAAEEQRYLPTDNPF